MKSLCGILALLALLAWNLDSSSADFMKGLQPGRDGNKTVSTMGEVVNRYYPVLNVSSDNFTVVLQTAPSDLLQGDLVMLYQVAGATVYEGNNKIFGLIEDYGCAGFYEFGVIYNVSGPNVELMETLTKPFGPFYPPPPPPPPSGGSSSNPYVQLVFVPQYDRFEVFPSGSVVATPWSLLYPAGGLVVVVANDATLEGSLSTDGAGSLGGDPASAPAPSVCEDPSSPPRSSTIASPFYNPSAGGQHTGAQKGSGIAVVDGLMQNAYGRGSPANGGGGGSTRNSGGGGGSNSRQDLSLSPWDGAGAMDPAYARVWTDVEGLYEPLGVGGGRGGYSGSVLPGNVTLDPPGGCASWGGDARSIVGGLGGRPLVQDPLQALFFGGGGGAGEGNASSTLSSPEARAGGRGGGVAMVFASTLSGRGLVSSSGGGGGLGDGEGAGGGGAGGTVLLAFSRLELASTNLTLAAEGGGGGNTSYYAPCADCLFGPGGGGTGGQVFVLLDPSEYGTPVANATGVAGLEHSTAGGRYGVSLDPLSYSFPPSGATSGETTEPSYLDLADACQVARLPCAWLMPPVSPSSSSSLTPILSASSSVSLEASPSASGSQLPSTSPLYRTPSSNPLPSSVLFSSSSSSSNPLGTSENPPSTPKKEPSKAGSLDSTPSRGAKKSKAYSHVVKPTAKNILKEKATVIAVSASVSAVGSGSLCLSVSFCLLFYRRKKNKEFASSKFHSQTKKYDQIEQNQAATGIQSSQNNVIYEEKV